MGTQVTSSDQNDSKQQMVVSTVAAGATLLIPGQLAIWHGEDLADRNMESIAAFEVCRNALREAGFPEPLGEIFITALIEVGSASSAVVVTNGAIPPVKITDVFIVYSDGYLGAGRSAMFMRRIDAAMDVLMESTLKAA